MTPTVKTTASHVLFAVNDAPLDGYGIVRAVRRRTCGRVVLMPGALFSAIRDMVRLGFIVQCEAGRFSGGGYRITRSGRRQLGPEGVAATAPARSLPFRDDAHHMGEGG
jgi:DNA-binding PadR family transcriptional regulator